MELNGILICRYEGTNRPINIRKFICKSTVLPNPLLSIVIGVGRADLLVIGH